MKTSRLPVIVCLAALLSVAAISFLPLPSKSRTAEQQTDDEIIDLVFCDLSTRDSVPMSFISKVPRDVYFEAAAPECLGSAPHPIEEAKIAKLSIEQRQQLDTAVTNLGDRYQQGHNIT